jgi:hypothetical protein
MLRVEPSNLPKPRGAPRARRLLPSPPATSQRTKVASRHEIVPPPDASSPPPTELALPQPASGAERWSVRLELGDADIAKLYGQGLTRGAVVWKKGMLEWRPLLITPELAGLLRRTRTTLTELPAVPELNSATDELTLPRPARVPSSILPPALANLPVTPTTVAPIAMDVEESPKQRRPVEFVAVAVAAFTLAWIGRSHLHPQPEQASLVVPALAAAAAAPPAAAVPAAKAVECAPAPAAQVPASTIPTVSIRDLPLVGEHVSVATATTTASLHRSRATRLAAGSSTGPRRSELVAALWQVARAAGSCGERGGPVQVVVSFASSGVARSIQVSGPDLPAPTRSCIIRAASRARVPAFTGSPVTVSKTL